MRLKFLRCVIGYLFLLCGLLVLICVLSTVPACKPAIAALTDTKDYMENIPMAEISPALEQVTAQPEAKKLIIGDSVCARVFNHYAAYNPNYCVVGTNRGIVMSGQYILGSLFLETHPEATDVYLVLTTNSMITEYETAYGYQYAVQPFLADGNLSRLDDITLKKMQQTYGKFVTNKEMVNFVDSSPILKKAYLNLLNEYNPIFVQPEIPDTVERYIVKLDRLCKEYGVTLHLIPAPIAEGDDRRKIEAAIEASYITTEVYELFPDYYENLRYYPQDLFEDGIHPKYDNAIWQEMIKDICENTPSLEDFNLP